MEWLLPSVNLQEKTHSWLPGPDSEGVQASTAAVHMQSPHDWNVSKKEESLGNSLTIYFPTKKGELQRWCCLPKMLEGDLFIILCVRVADTKSLDCLNAYSSFSS